jgi:hypothetical protein
LKDGEAESYQNIEIKYIHGRKAILTIFHDGEEQEKIELSQLKQREDMHAMFLEKGFVLKPAEEIEAIRQQREKDTQEEKDQKEIKKLEKDATKFEKKTAREIQELQAERDRTSDQAKKRNLEKAMEEKSQQMENRRQETWKRGEEIRNKLKHVHSEL